MANNPYIVQIRYKGGVIYPIFCENEIYAKNLQRQLEDEINRETRIMRYYNTDPVAYPPSHPILISIENVLEVRIIFKSEHMTDLAWLTGNIKHDIS